MNFENSENNENKNTFENKIKDWVLLDNKIHNLNEELKNLKERKDLLNNDINNYMNTNNLTNNTIKINNGYLKLTQIKNTQTLTFKYLENCLKEIIKNEEQVNTIINYIKNKREITYNTSLKRYYNK